MTTLRRELRQKIATILVNDDDMSNMLFCFCGWPTIPERGDAWLNEISNKLADGVLDITGVQKRIERKGNRV